MYRTIKITAGMTQEFEIIWTNASDHVDLEDWFGNKNAKVLCIMLA